MRTVTRISLLVAVTAVAVAAARRRPAGQPVDPDLWVTEPAPAGPPEPPVPLPEERHGSLGDRGSGQAVRLDLSRARSNHLEPVVEFLTYLQEKRGDRSHLLFVRYDDLDALAAGDGITVEDFLSRLDQLGVVVSQN
jgi:hypothetical protein